MQNNSKQDLFNENLRRRYYDIAILYAHVSQGKISNVAKSCYFRAAIILACTIVEGLLYKLVETDMETNSRKLGKRIVYKQIHHIPKGYSENRLVLGIQEYEEINLSTLTTFQDLIKYARDYFLIDNSQEKKLDYVRKLRNSIHLQSLTEKDRGYTRLKLDGVFEVINFLINRDNGAA